MQRQRQQEDRLTVARGPDPAVSRTRSAPPRCTPAAEGTTPAPGTTILVVEDDASTQEVLGMVLDHAGYGTYAATHGVAALAYLATHPRPACILLDLDLPIMNGWAFRRVQQGTPALADIPVVIVSALPQTATAAAQLGVTILPPLHVRPPLRQSK
jgi:CheY-like chemotaxis protein